MRAGRFSVFGLGGTTLCELDRINICLNNN
jgi:hypothetical protein